MKGWFAKYVEEKGHAPADASQLQQFVLNRSGKMSYKEARECLASMGESPQVGGLPGLCESGAHASRISAEANSAAHDIADEALVASSEVTHEGTLDAEKSALGYEHSVASEESMITVEVIGAAAGDPLGSWQLPNTAVALDVKQQVLATPTGHCSDLTLLKDAKVLADDDALAHIKGLAPTLLLQCVKRNACDKFVGWPAEEFWLPEDSACENCRLDYTKHKACNKHTRGEQRQRIVGYGDVESFYICGTCGIQHVCDKYTGQYWREMGGHGWLLCTTCGICCEEHTACDSWNLDGSADLSQDHCMCQTCGRDAGGHGVHACDVFEGDGFWGDSTCEHCGIEKHYHKYVLNDCDSDGHNDFDHDGA